MVLKRRGERVNWRFEKGGVFIYPETSEMG